MSTFYAKSTHNSNSTPYPLRLAQWFPTFFSHHHNFSGVNLGDPKHRDLRLMIRKKCDVARKGVWFSLWRVELEKNLV